MGFELIDQEKFEIKNPDIKKLDNIFYQMSLVSTITSEVLPDHVSYNVFLRELGYTDNIVEIEINFVPLPLTSHFKRRSEKREEVIKLALEKADKTLNQDRNIIRVTVSEDGTQSFSRTFKRTGHKNLSKENFTND